MWFPVSTVAALCVILDISEETIANHDLENTFRQRSKEDWQDVWHKEKYPRCRETLLQHLYWACEKDIYRLTRRSQWTPNLYGEGKKVKYPLLTREHAQQILRVRRAGSSITLECCNSVGCTWEEYAEYCSTNKRHLPFV